MTAALLLCLALSSIAVMAWFVGSLFFGIGWVRYDRISYTHRNQIIGPIFFGLGSWAFCAWYYLYLSRLFSGSQAVSLLGFMIPAKFGHAVNEQVIHAAYTLGIFYLYASALSRMLKAREDKIFEKILFLVFLPIVLLFGWFSVNSIIRDWQELPSLW